MFTVIIPLYNKQRSILYTLESVINQTFSDFEVIIVDDGSTDNSYLEAQKMAISDSRIHLINKKNGGVSSARNAGVLQAKYNFIAFIDADDIWEPNYLEEQSKNINDFPEAGMWGVNWNYLYANNIIPKKHQLEQNFRGIVRNYWQRNLHLFWTSAIVVRKSVFDEIGYFDERIRCGEDLDMWYRIILNFPVVFNTITLAHYVLDSENRIMNNKIPLNTHFPFFIEKYAVYRKNNKYFRNYFDRECLYRLFPYVLENRKYPFLHKVLRNIDLSEHKLSFRLRFLFPKLYNLYKYLKSLLKLSNSTFNLE